MKIVKNGYTRTKLNGVYAENYPILVRTILNGFIFILEENGISTGEPCYNKQNNLYGFYTSYSSFFYNDVTDGIEIFYNKSFHNNKKDIVIKKYKNIDETLIQDLKEFIKSKKKIPTLIEYLEDVEKFKELGEDWNSYRCNPVSEISVDILKNFITYLYPIIELNNVSFHPHPIADGGSEIRRPDVDSRSIAALEITNGNRTLNFEVTKNGEIEPMAYEHLYDDKTYESHGLDWPQEYLKYGDDYVICKDYTTDEFLKWAINWIHYK